MFSFATRLRMFRICLLTLVTAFAVSASAQVTGMQPQQQSQQKATGGSATPAIPGSSRSVQPNNSSGRVQPVGPEQPATTISGSSPAAGSGSAPLSGLSAAPDLRIGPGDLLEISVYGAPDFNAVPARVNGSGEILLPLIGSQKVEGLTTDEAAKMIAGKLGNGGYYNNPQVTVFAREYATQGVSVLGEVQRPGVYPVLGQRKLFDAISVAGGLTPRAGRMITVTHKGDKPINVPLSGSDGNMDANVDIRPGDTIVVSKAGIVYVVGDVRLPGGFVMDNGNMTVLQAVAMAQGANGTAKLDEAKLIRRGPEGQKETPLPLSKMLQSKSPDMSLQPDDIVFVPNSAAKSVARRGLEAIVQAATGVTIYRSRVP